jgi:broad specificity phosphatase PhoE
MRRAVLLEQLDEDTGFSADPGPMTGLVGSRWSGTCSPVDDGAFRAGPDSVRVCPVRSCVLEPLRVEHRATVRHPDLAVGPRYRGEQDAGAVVEVSRRTSLLLVRHAPSSATRRFLFPSDEPLDDGGRRMAGQLAGQVEADQACTSPALRCRETAMLAGYPDAEVNADLAELDFGSWAGRDPHEVSRTAPAELEGWYADPNSAPHGGETLDALSVRLGLAFDRLRERGGTTAVFTHGGPIKLAVLQALEAPMSSMWRLDIAPCSLTELHARPDGGWTLVRSNVRLLTGGTA